ncbi:MAG: hypothetical protein MHM6MM_000811 [Cercozoa sp. M6MM]
MLVRARCVARPAVRAASQVVPKGKNDGYVTPAEANDELLGPTGETGGFAHVYQSFDPISFMESTPEDPHGAVTVREAQIVASMDDLFGHQDLSFLEGDSFGTDSSYFLVDYGDDKVFNNKKYLLDAVAKGKKLVPFYVSDTRHQTTQLIGVEGESLLWTFRRHNIMIDGSCNGMWVRDDDDDEGQQSQCGRCTVMLSKAAADACTEDVTVGEDNAIARNAFVPVATHMTPHRLACCISVVPEFKGEKFVVTPVFADHGRTRQIAPLPQPIERLVGTGEPMSLAEKTKLEQANPEEYVL